MIKINKKLEKENVVKIADIGSNGANGKTINLEMEDGTETNVDQFNKLYMEVYKKVVSAQEYGDWAEYYDEDGLVIMTTQMMEDGTLSFDFGDGRVFNYRKEGFEDKVCPQ